MNTTSLSSRLRKAISSEPSVMWWVHVTDALEHTRATLRLRKGPRWENLDSMVAQARLHVAARSGDPSSLDSTRNALLSLAHRLDLADR